MDCLFCRIVKGEIPSNKVYEDDMVYAFHDISPIAPVHFLVIPKEHISGAAAVTPENSAVIAHIFEVIAKVTAEMGLEGGYRVITNHGKDARQSVPHLHFHILAGKELPDNMG